MESPVASSSTSANDGPSKSNSASTGSASFPGVPSATPPFFANPFMSPFMSGSNQILQNGPNIQQMQQQFHQFAAAAAATMGSADPAAGQQPSDIRMNPFTGGFFLPPNQYQEMMQQYLQSLMLQAGNAPPQPPPSSERETPTLITTPNTVTQSPSPPLASNDPAAAAFHGLATLNLGQLNLASPTAATPPPSMTAAAPMPFNSITGSTGSRQSTPSKVSSASVGIASGGASTNCSSSPSPSFSMMNGLPENIKDQPGAMTQDQSDITPASKDNVAPMEPVDKDVIEENPIPSGSDEGGNTETDKPKNSEAVSLSDEPPKRKFDARADELFRKQMNEIEQEINRRIQNRNVRKLNEEELSQLLNETGFGNFVEAGKPNSEVSHQMGHLIRDPSPPPAPKNPTLNQLRSSFSPPETKGPVMGMDPFPAMQPSPLPSYPFSFGSVQMAQPPSEPATAPFMSASTPYSVQQHQPVQTTPVGYIPGLDPLPQPTPSQPMDMPEISSSTLPNPATITPEMAAALLKQIQESNPQLLSSLGLVPASQAQEKKKLDDAEAYRLPAPPSAASIPKRNGPNVFHANEASTSLDENGWKQLDKRHSLNGDNTAINQTTTGQENNKENSQEPIWVMRDSYLKRLQREEQRNKELQNGSGGPSTTGQNGADEDEEETDKLLTKDHNAEIEEHIKANKKPAAAKKEVFITEPAVLIEGVLFRARYLGSTQLTCDGRPTKSSRMAQAQEAVARVKAPEGEIQPSTEIDLFISTEKIMVLNTDLQDILMDHALRSISYIADIGDVVVLMARRIPQNSSTSSEDDEDMQIRRTPRVVCHVFESEEASFIAQSIGQAFQVAYVEFLKANGIDDPAYLREIDYQEVLNSQELLGEELDLFSNKETQKDIVIPKKVGEPLGVVVVESGWGSMLPTVVVAKMEPNAPSARSNQLNIGDQIIAINGISLVGLPLAKAQQNIKNAKTSTAVRLTIVSTPPVVEVRIRRPDTKYQLGFSVQNGVICSLLRGGIAERGGIRVG